MKTLTSGKFFLLAATATFIGCSSEYVVEEVAADQTKLDGVPFRVKERYTLTLYYKATSGYDEIKSFVETLPREDKLYVLKLNAAALSDSKAKFTLNPDGTLSNIDISSEVKADEALTALGVQTKAVGAALSEKRAAEDARREAKEAATKTEQAEAESDLGADELNQRNALSSLQAVELAEAELEGLPANAPLVQRIKAQQKVGLAKFDANVAHRKVGLPAPYP